MTKWGLGYDTWHLIGWSLVFRRIFTEQLQHAPHCFRHGRQDNELDNPGVTVLVKMTWLLLFPARGVFFFVFQWSVHSRRDLEFSVNMNCSSSNFAVYNIDRSGMGGPFSQGLSSTQGPKGTWAEPQGLLLHNRNFNNVCTRRDAHRHRLWGMLQFTQRLVPFKKPHGDWRSSAL